MTSHNRSEMQDHIDCCWRAAALRARMGVGRRVGAKAGKVMGAKRLAVEGVRMKVVARSQLQVRGLEPVEGQPLLQGLELELSPPQEGRQALCHSQGLVLVLPPHW